MSMTRIPSWLSVIIAASLAAVGGVAMSAQDKYTVQVPNGLAFSEFKGYEDWQPVAVSRTEGVLAVILANPVMIDAYRAGVPGNGKNFPDSGGWGYAQFNYDAASDTFTPEGSGSNCGYACHTIVAAKDYIFTAYGKR